MNKTFLFENMPTISTTLIANVDDADNEEKYPQSEVARGKATPGQPMAFFC